MPARRAANAGSKLCCGATMPGDERGPAFAIAAPVGYRLLPVDPSVRRILTAGCRRRSPVTGWKYEPWLGELQRLMEEA